MNNGIAPAAARRKAVAQRKADRNHHGLRSRPDFDRRMELAGLEPATSWVR
jgi:hypothetical protein